MTASAKALVLALALALTGCSGKSGDATGPNVEPPPNDPGLRSLTIRGRRPRARESRAATCWSRSTDRTRGSWSPSRNPDGTVIGLYRFEASTLTMDALQTFALELRYTDDKAPLGIDDEGEFKGAGPVTAEGAIPLTFYSAPYEDQFTGVVLGDFVALKYDFDGDGEMDTSFGFRRRD